MDNSPASNRPRLLDLFSGAGGAAVGYSLAGFKVTGVDIVAQPHYPFEFILSDALALLSDKSWFADEFDAVHASPPCQRYSYMAACRPELAESYPDLIAPLREFLNDTGLPWVIENVPPAPLKDPVMLCGQMFGLELYRHRMFEANFDITVPSHPMHTVPASRAGHWTPGTVMSVAGHVSPVAQARRAMGIDWMNREEMAEAIPPAFTEFIGRQLLDALAVAA